MAMRTVGGPFYFLRPGDTYDLVTLNASVQYFGDIGRLVERLRELLIRSGEIHILDSPFYRSWQIRGARRRSRAHYRDLGVPEMADHYFHHSYSSIRRFGTRISPDPSFFSRLSRALASSSDPVPFPWIRLGK